MATTTTLSGEVIEELKQQATEHFWPHARQTNDMFGDNGLKLVSDSKGVWVYDVEGKEWFDTLSGMWLVNIGHGRRKLLTQFTNKCKVFLTPLEELLPLLLQNLQEGLLP